MVASYSKTNMEKDNYKQYREAALYYWRSRNTGELIAIPTMDESHVIDIIWKYGENYLLENGYVILVERAEEIRRRADFYSKTN